MGAVQGSLPGLSARLLVVGLAALLSACIFLVPSSERGGEHCQFTGIETACGKCLADRCADAVDLCCGSDACGGVIADVQACASQNDAAACARTKQSDDRGGKHRELSACATRSCADACGPPPPPKNVTRCKPAYVTSIEACTCELDPNPNDTTCTDVGHPKLRCCAPDAWPGPALSCDCLAIICVPLSDGCLCELTAMDDSGRAPQCQGAHCCVDPKANQCRCGSTDCHNDEVPVPSCAIEQLGCPAGRHSVDSCSVPASP